MNREITKKELMLAIAMSTFHQTTHVNFIPIGTEYVTMLRTMRNQNLIKPMGEHFYTPTVKGWNYLKYQDITLMKIADQEIDAFVDKL